MIKKKKQIKVIPKRFVLEILYGYTKEEEDDYWYTFVYRNKIKDLKLPHRIMHILWNS